MKGCSSAQFEPEGLVDLLNTSVEALDTDDELVDKSFDLDSSIKSDTIHYDRHFLRRVGVTIGLGGQSLTWPLHQFPVGECTWER